MMITSIFHILKGSFSLDHENVGLFDKELMPFALVSRYGNWLTLNSLPNNKIFENFKFKADEKIITTNQKLVFELGRVENIVGKKKKKLVSSIFSFSHNVFQSFLFQRC